MFKNIFIGYWAVSLFLHFICGYVWLESFLCSAIINILSMLALSFMYLFIYGKK